MLLSVVIPVYKAQDCIEELLSRCTAAVAFTQGNYELILVDDGSPDNSWKLIEQYCKTQKNITAIKLSRNFGQHHAITAGLDHCNGDWVVVMDCDLQDKPEAIEQLYNEAKKGFDMVLAKRVNRKDSFFKKMQSNFFYKVFSFLTGIKYDGSVGNFGIYSRKVINAVKAMREPMRAFSPMARWTGFSKSYINADHGESKRVNGQSTYTYRKIFTLAFDTILSYSDKPLRLIIGIGFFISLTAVAVAVFYLIHYLNGRILVLGYTSIILSIWFLGGLTIFTLGVLGLYISKIFAGIKNRPLYIIDEILEN